jgi:hypothetical protein
VCTPSKSLFVANNGYEFALALLAIVVALVLAGWVPLMHLYP